MLVRRRRGGHRTSEEDDVRRLGSEIRDTMQAQHKDRLDAWEEKQRQKARGVSLAPTPGIDRIKV